MKKVFIINAKAGNGQAKQIASYLNEIFYSNNDVNIVYTKDKTSTIVVAEHYKNQDCVIYSVGGDGTLNDVVTGLAGGNAYLGILPCGSGNDFMRNIDDKTAEIDLGKVNDKYFINVVSFGIDAEVANKANELNKKGSSKFVYPKGILLTFPKFKSPTITVDNEEKEITILAVCNGSFYGNGFKIAPYADISDGKFDLYLVEKVNKLEMLYLFSKLLKGNHDKCNKVSYSHISNLQINSQHPLICNIDGEITTGTTFNIALQKEKIKYYQEDDERLKKLIYPYMRK